MWAWMEMEEKTRRGKRWACLDGGVNRVNGAKFAPNLPLRCQTCGANVVGQMFCPPNSIYP
jgi:hypothetical protein